MDADNCLHHLTNLDFITSRASFYIPESKSRPSSLPNHGYHSQLSYHPGLQGWNPRVQHSDGCAI